MVNFQNDLCAYKADLICMDSELFTIESFVCIHRVGDGRNNIMRSYNTVHIGGYIYATCLSTMYSEHLYNPTFSLIQPLYEVQSPYLSMVRGTP